MSTLSIIAMSIVAVLLAIFDGYMLLKISNLHRLEGVTK